MSGSVPGSAARRPLAAERLSTRGPGRLAGEARTCPPAGRIGASAGTRAPQRGATPPTATNSRARQRQQSEARLQGSAHIAIVSADRVDVDLLDGRRGLSTEKAAGDSRKPAREIRDQ